jgi:Family of unknown function (DUF6084)
MPDLEFSVESAEPIAYSATPLLALNLRIRNRDTSNQIRSIALQCQVQIEAPRRHYSPQEQEGLLDLFGEPERWSQTLRNTLWTHASVNVAGFDGETVVPLPVPCTFDFNIAATKYFHALEGGVVPLCLLFSGTVFYQDQGIQIAPIPWNKEARFKMPVEVWKQVIDRHYPNTAWLALRRDTFDRLHEYKMRLGVPTWEEALDRLLAAPVEEALV